MDWIMYSILRLEEVRKLTLGEHLRRFLFNQPPERIFAELSYDPFSGFLVYKDQNREQTMKKDLVRALVVYADIRDRAALFSIDLQVTVNNIASFIQKSSDPLLDDNLILGPERISEREAILILKEFLTSAEMDLVSSQVYNLVSRKVILERF